MEYSKVHGPKIKNPIWDRNNLNYLHFPDADMNIGKTVCKAPFQTILNAWWVFFFQVNVRIGQKTTGIQQH